MKSVKKRFKRLLKSINVTANQLLFISSDLTLLSEVQVLAGKVLLAEQVLSQLAEDTKKNEFVPENLDERALQQLEEIIDIDLISQLEGWFFGEMADQADSGMGDFLQQLLQKIAKLHVKLLEDIQQLIALFDEERQD